MAIDRASLYRGVTPTTMRRASPSLMMAVQGKSGSIPPRAPSHPVAAANINSEKNGAADRSDRGLSNAAVDKANLQGGYLRGDTASHGNGSGLKVAGSDLVDRSAQAAERQANSSPALTV